MSDKSVEILRGEIGPSSVLETSSKHDRSLLGDLLKSSVISGKRQIDVRKRSFFLPKNFGKSSEIFTK